VMQATITTASTLVLLNELLGALWNTLARTSSLEGGGCLRSAIGATAVYPIADDALLRVLLVALLHGVC
jgi:hypothetical protein